MAPFFSPASSSSPASSTRPTHLHRPESNSRRRECRSSSWSAWAAGPLFRQLSLTNRQRRGSIHTKDTQPHSQGLLVQNSRVEGKVASGDWLRPPEHRKSITFEENTGTSGGSMAGTVMRLRNAGKRLVTGIFPQTDLGEVQENDQEDNSDLLPGSWNEERSLNVGSTHSQYWRDLRHELEIEAAAEQSRRLLPPNTGEHLLEIQQEPKKRLRTVSREDHLISRGANPRTGMVSPSIMSEDDRGSQEGLRDRTMCQKWRLKGDQWISMDADQSTPLSTPPADETAKHSFRNMQSKPRDPSIHQLAQLPKSGLLSELEGEIVDNMPSVKETCAMAMAAQQIIDFQKSIERVYREGGEMVDPNTLPSPRAVTPEGLSTPPKRLSKKGAVQIKHKPLGNPPSASPSRSRAARQNDDSPEVANVDRSADNDKYGLSLVLPTLAPEGRGWRSLDQKRKNLNRFDTHKNQQDTWGPPQNRSFLDDREAWAKQNPIEVLVSLTTNGYPFPAPRRLKTPPLSTPIWVRAERQWQNVIQQLKQVEKQPVSSRLGHCACLSREMPDSKVGKIPNFAVNTGPLAGRQRELLDTLKGNPPREQAGRGHLFTATTTVITTSTPTTTTSQGPWQEKLPFMPLHPHGPVSDHFASFLGQRTFLTYEPKSQAPRGEVDTLATIVGRTGSLEGDPNGRVGADTPTRHTVIADIPGCTHISRMPNGDNGTKTRIDEPFCICRECYKSGIAPRRLSPKPASLTVDDGLSIRRREGSIREKVLGLASLLSVTDEFSYHPAIPMNTSNRKCDTCDQGNESHRQNGLCLLDKLIFFFPFPYELLCSHNSLPILCSILRQVLSMSSHCVKTAMRICHTCHRSWQTGILPSVPKSRQKVGELLQEIGRLGTYCVILGRVVLLTGRGLGYLIRIGSWVVWIVRMAGG